MLCHVRGATCYEDVRTFGDVTYDTFKDACEARGLLEGDAEWDLCLREASEWQLAPSLRQLFVTLLLYANPVHPEILWDNHREALSDDFVFQERQVRQPLTPCNG